MASLQVDGVLVDKKDRIITLYLPQITFPAQSGGNFKYSNSLSNTHSLEGLSGGIGGGMAMCTVNQNKTPFYYEIKNRRVEYEFIPPIQSSASIVTDPITITYISTNSTQLTTDPVKWS